MTTKYRVQLLTVLSFLYAVPAMAQILTIYSDQGTPANTTVFADGAGATHDGNFTGETAPEGAKVWRTQTSIWAFWGVFYNSQQDFSAYAGGDLRFWAKTTNCTNVKIEVEQWNGVKPSAKPLSDYSCTPNTWQHYRIPVNSFGATLNSMKSPFMISTNVNATFFVDQVRWTGPSVASPWFDVKIKRRSDNVEVSSVTWSNINLDLSPNWVAADQYLELQVDPSVTPWGLQIYTENKAGDANPQYTGTGDPVGLVEVESPTRTLPLCWRMVDVTTTTLTIIEAPKPEAPAEHYLFSQELGAGFRCFLWMMDRQTTGFTDGFEYATLWDERGIHIKEAADLSGPHFVAGNPPNYLYIGANFTNGRAARTYKTSTLRLEFFTE